MREIYLIRHGTPIFDGDQKRCIGQTDCLLSAQGEDEILKVKEYLSHKGIEKIYSSPLKRCRASAKLIAGNKIPIVYLEELREIHMGNWENKTFEEIRQKYPEEYRKRGEDFAHFTPENGENFVECLRRSKRAFVEIAKSNTGNIAVIGHAGVNRALLCWLLNKDMNTLFEIKQPYGCVNIIKEADGQLYVDSVGYLADNKTYKVQLNYNAVLE